MRNWVEKLAKLIEHEGVCTSFAFYKVQCYEIWFSYNVSLVNIRNILTGECSNFKLYEEEQDLLKKIIKRCKERTEDSLIKQINNL